MADNNDSLSGTPPVLCAKGCGFFGSASTMSMCSKCFREHQRSSSSDGLPAPSSQSSSIAAAAVAAAAAPAAMQLCDDAATSASTAPAAMTGPSPPTSWSEDDSAPGASSSASPQHATAVSPCAGVDFAPDGATKNLQVMDARPLGESAPAPPVPIDGSVGSGLSGEVADSSCDPPPRKVQKNRGKCFKCRTKVGLLGIECRCGYVFCGKHRYSDQHECDFDYAALQREKLTRDNPVVAASKINKI